MTHRILDHERHQLARVAADIKKLDIVFHHEFPEGAVGRDAHAMAPLIFEHLGNVDEWLHVAPAANHHDDNVEGRGCRLGGGIHVMFLHDHASELTLGEGAQEVREAAVFRGVERDVNSAIVGVNVSLRVELFVCD